jgi:hypothetical protein
VFWEPVAYRGQADEHSKGNRIVCLYETRLFLSRTIYCSTIIQKEDNGTRNAESKISVNTLAVYKYVPLSWNNKRVGSGVSCHTSNSEFSRSFQQFGCSKCFPWIPAVHAGAYQCSV